MKPHTVRVEPRDPRLRTLKEVEQAWMEHPTVGSFSKWLKQEITHAEGKERFAANKAASRKKAASS